jgi:predicted RNA-binding protein with PIN domain
LCDLKIVTDESKARLDERIRNRYAALYAKHGGPGLENGDGATVEYLLQCALEGQIPLIFLIDGHNTLYAIQSRYSRPQDHRGPPSEAREWLVNDIVQVFANAHNCRVIIVFDGPERTESNPAGNVKVIFSGGGGSDVENRADNVLVDEARFLREADPEMRMLLATNDNGLASRAAAFGVRNIAPTALLAYLR